MTGENLPDTVPAVPSVDYEEIESAVMETERGRWFLDEFARRHRHADTERLLEAIARIEENVAARPAPATAGAADPEVAGMRRAICEMAEQIASAKREIAAIRPNDGQQRDISDATAELDAIVTSTETATSDILGAAEQIQELAWTLREEGAPSEFCDALDERATEIYTACSFQDITGQRTTKVVRVLQMLEARLGTMAELWSSDGGISAAASGDHQDAEEADPEANLLNGPALEGEGSSQDEVDRMMEELAREVEAAGAADMPADEAAVADEPVDVAAEVEFDRISSTDDDDSAAEAPADPAIEDAELFVAEADEAEAATLAEATETAPDAAMAEDAQPTDCAATAEVDAAEEGEKEQPDGEPRLPELSEKDYEALFA